MNKIILLDSNSLLHRAYYALAQSNLNDASGRPTGAVFGFVSMLSKLIREEKPTHIAAAFDLKAPTFRHKMYNAYKGTRKPMPEDLVPQVDMIKDVLRAFNIKIVEKETYEADDIIGTLAKRFNAPTLIVTGDRDSFQLIDDTTTVLYTKKGITDVVRYNLDRLKEDGFTPETVVDYKGICGDSSDNIPGIAGIGDKTAKTLLRQYRNLDGVLSHADEIKGKLGEKIKNGKDIAKLSYELATINTNVPIDVTLDDIAFDYPLSHNAKDALTALDFTSIVKRFDFKDFVSTDVLNDKIDVLTTELNTLEEIESVVAKHKNGSVAIDIDDNITFAFSSKQEYIAKISYDLFGGVTREDILNALKPIFENDKNIICTDYKKLLHCLTGMNIKPYGTIYDVFLLCYLTNGGRTFSDVESLNNNYNIEGKNIALLFEAIPAILKDLRDKNLENLYFKIELPLVNVLYSMECAGIKVDKSVLDEFKQKYADEIDALTNDIYRYAGESFNINSPKQLTTILFDKLGLKSKKKTKTGLSVNIDVLMKLYDEHPIIPLIIRYRTISKLQSTYVIGLEKEIAQDGRIHTDYKQTVANTGRLSSTEPNLQNIPTRSSEGKEIRRAFVADSDKILLSADYSQIELRLMAHLSGDENLIKAYNESRDIHTSTAAEIYGVSQSEVTSDMRRDAKAVNFGIIYGISDFGLANNLSINQKQAKQYIEKYFQTYPKVKEFMDGLVKTAEEKGYVSTMFNRIRIMTELKSTNYSVREFGKRAAMNFPLQGSAADIIKIAMLKVYDALKNTNAELLLQVHDELIVECPIKESENVKNILVDCMENACKLSVPLTVNVASGKSWYEA